MNEPTRRPTPPLIRCAMRGDRDYQHVADLLPALQAATGAESDLRLVLTAAPDCALELLAPCDRNLPSAGELCGHFQYRIGEVPHRHRLRRRPDLPLTERKRADESSEPAAMVLSERRIEAPASAAGTTLERLIGLAIVLLHLRRVNYVAGIRALGTDHASTLRGLERVLGELGPGPIHCIGSSAGSFGALLLGADLGARRILCLAGPTHITHSLGELTLALQREFGPDALPDPDLLDAREHLRRAKRMTQVRYVFGGNNEIDRAEGAHLAGLDGVELICLHGVDKHNVMLPLLEAGTFDQQLRWLLDA